MTTTLPQLTYECDGCGACCRHLILEAQHYDAIREPRIAAEAVLLDGHGKIELANAEWSLNRRDAGKDFACLFLGDDNRCGIYSTRPHMCVCVQAGGDKCQQARRSAKLPELQPTKPHDGSAIERVRDLFRGDGEDD